MDYDSIVQTFSSENPPQTLEEALEMFEGYNYDVSEPNADDIGYGDDIVSITRYRKPEDATNQVY